MGIGFVYAVIKVRLTRDRTQDPSRSKLEMNQPSLSQDRPFGAPPAFSHSQSVISVDMPTSACTKHLIQVTTPNEVGIWATSVREGDDIKGHSFRTCLIRNWGEAL